jgi:hypothetical protein
MSFNAGGNRIIVTADNEVLLLSGGIIIKSKMQSWGKNGRYLLPDTFDLA